MFSVVYQDFARYYISMNDNIALGDVNKMQEEENPERVREAIMKAGLEETAAKLPWDWIPPGENQGRRPGCVGENGRKLLWPGLFSILHLSGYWMNLQHPWDPVSESRMYKEFEKISRDKTTIFISHRLGSTKLAHEIFVLGNGGSLKKEIISI